MLPDEFEPCDDFHDCELCRLGEEGDIMQEIYTMADCTVTNVPRGKTYEMIASHYNAHLDVIDRSAVAGEYGANVRWTNEMVVRHFESHRLSLQDILVRTIYTIHVKQFLVNSKMTYTRTIGPDGRQMIKTDSRMEALWLKLAAELRQCVMQYARLFGVNHQVPRGFGHIPVPSASDRRRFAAGFGQ